MNDIDPSMLIIKAAEELKKKGIKSPEWASFVKTGVHKERPPVNSDWWYHRMAAVLRSVAVLGPIGVSKLRTKYGGKQRRGHKPARFARGSGNILRKVLQQLEELNYVKQATVANHKGRIITREGKLFLNSVASEITPVKAQAPKKTESAPKVEKVKKEAKPKKEPKTEKVEAEPKESVEKTPVKKEAKEAPEVKEEAKEVPKVKKEIKEAPEVKEEPAKDSPEVKE